VSPGLYAEYRAGSPSHFLFFDEVHGLDGRKLGEVKSRLEAARAERAAAEDTSPLAALEQLSDEERAVLAADIAGDRRTLVADSAIPAALAGIYLFLLLYFRAIGGYRAIHITEGLAGAPPAKTA
jgi:hypothetical protein